MANEKNKTKLSVQYFTDWSNPTSINVALLILSITKEALLRVEQNAKARQLTKRELSKPGWSVSGAYQKNLLVNLQELLYNMGAFAKGISYKKAVDGLDGKLTLAAIKKALSMGYSYDPTSKTLSKNSSKFNSNSTSLAKQTKRTEDPRYLLAVQAVSLDKFGVLEKTPTGFSLNHPAIEMIADLGTSLINRGGRALFGDNVTLIKRNDITDVPEDLKEVLRRMIKQKGGKKGGFSGKDWKKFQGTYTGGHRDVLERMNSPEGQIEHTLGQFNWHTDADGNTIVTDTYDFNTGEGTPGEGLYSKIRSFMGRFGSKDTDPDAGKSHYAINLGKI